MMHGHTNLKIDLQVSRVCLIVLVIRLIICVGDQSVGGMIVTVDNGITER